MENYIILCVHSRATLSSNNASTSIPIDLKLSQLRNAEHVADSANSWAHEAAINGEPVAA